MTSILPTLTDLGWNGFFQSQLDSDEYETLTRLRVSRVHRNAVGTIGEQGPQRLNIPPDLATSDQAAGIAVGDWLLADQDRIIRLLDRKSVLQRRSAGDGHTAQLIAANVDTLIIVSSCNADFNVARLERYLSLAYQGDIEPLLLLTKADLCDDPNTYLNLAREQLPGLNVQIINATDPGVPDQLAPWCSTGQTVALLGSSGVGKSTLINRLSDADALTQDIREDDAKGRHTTTGRSMYRTDTGGWVIDTPGMRSLALSDVAEGVDMVFADLAKLAQGCKFRDCAHDTEPGCAIQAAIQAGDIDADRLMRWQKLQREDAYNSETLAQNRKRTRELGKKYAGGRAQSKAKRGEL